MTAAASGRGGRCGGPPRARVQPPGDLARGAANRNDPTAAHWKFIIPFIIHLFMEDHDFGIDISRAE